MTNTHLYDYGKEVGRGHMVDHHLTMDGGISKRAAIMLEAL